MGFKQFVTHRMLEWGEHSILFTSNGLEYVANCPNCEEEYSVGAMRLTVDNTECETITKSKDLSYRYLLTEFSDTCSGDNLYTAPEFNGNTFNSGSR